MEKRAEEDLVDDDDDEEEEEGHNYNVPPKVKSPFSTKKTNKRSWNYGTQFIIFMNHSTILSLSSSWLVALAPSSRSQATAQKWKITAQKLFYPATGLFCKAED